MCSHYCCIGKTPPAKKKPCKSEFDYKGWAAWNDWRRDPTRKREPMKTTRRSEKEAKRRIEMFQAARMERFLTGTHDCSKDCDSPSQCNHELREYHESRRSMTPESEASSPESCTDTEIEQVESGESDATDETPPPYKTSEAKKGLKRVVIRLTATATVGP
ncbi:hypothetical protein QQZ08_010359 [Neonectria magnoliae]|uniref:Uncharacterized protein n=1 Tax=Neonectria magnoliae TaxID=2732573 RepID=A0ABR1HHV7_9HYPO